MSGVPKFSFEFAPKLSVGTENDKFFLPNVALLVGQISTLLNLFILVLKCYITVSCAKGEFTLT